MVYPDMSQPPPVQMPSASGMTYNYFKRILNYYFTTLNDNS
jgi:hypothetical protein